jgi:hypothetical protein
MGAALVLVAGLLSVAAGVSILLDLRRFGTRLISLSLYTSAPIWKKDARPGPERVDLHRAMFGSGVTLVGLVIAVSSASALA